MTDQFAAIMRDGRFCDIALCPSSPHKLLPAHALVLAVSIPFFKNNLLDTITFLRPIDPGTGLRIVDLPLFSYDELAFLLQFVYTAHIDVHWDNVAALLRVADFFIQDKLTEHCTSFLRTQVHTPRTCVSVLVLAEEFRLTELLGTALAYARAHFAQLVQDVSFVHITPDLLVRLLSSDLLMGCTEDVAWAAVQACPGNLFAAPLVCRSALSAQASREISALAPETVFDRQLHRRWQLPGRLWVDMYHNEGSERVHTLLCWSHGRAREIFIRTPIPHTTHEAVTNMYKCAVFQNTLFWFSPLAFWAVHPDGVLEQLQLPDVTPHIHDACAALNGVVYTCGGLALGPFFFTAQAVTRGYRVHAREWVYCASMGMPRSLHALVGLGTYLFALGGESPAGGRSRSVECYDPVSNKWSAAADMLWPRSKHMATVYERSIVVVGGCASGRTCERYHLDADAWTPLPNLPTPRSGGALAVIAGELYVVGGNVGTATAAFAVKLVTGDGRDMGTTGCFWADTDLFPSHKFMAGTFACFAADTEPDFAEFSDE